MLKQNPFKPNNPIGVACFAGREEESVKFIKGLFNTKNGMPKNFLVTGPKGMGKTSFVKFMRAYSEGNVESAQIIFNFLSATMVASSQSTIQNIVKSTQTELESELIKVEPLRGYWRKLLNFASRVKVMDSGYEKPEDETELVALITNLATELCEVCERIKGYKSENRCGILLIFDEVSEVSNDVDLGYFFKILTQILDQKGGVNVSIALVGLPDLGQKIAGSNDSAMRVFEEIKIVKLSFDECRQAIIQGLYYANNVMNHGSNKTVKMDDEVLNTICEMSNGEPHLLQEIAYSVFDNDRDWVITEDDLVSCEVYKRLSGE